MREYTPDGAVLAAFIVENHKVRVCQGPVGSGKSVAAWMALWRHACEQVPGPDGKRKTRWLITRSTYPALEDTTLNTHLEWFPESEFGKLRRSRPFRRTMVDGDVEAELIFMALEGPEDVEKLKSLEITGAYPNEAQFMGLGMFADILDRCGRYPRYDPKRGEPGPTWHGIISDMNAPPHAHWAPIMRGVVPIPPWLPADERMKYERPKDWQFYEQPAGLIEAKGATGKIEYRENPRAENKRYHKDPHYYVSKIAGKTRSWIDTNVMNRPASETAGKPIYPMFSRVTHTFPEITANDQAPLLVGLDYGRTPAAVFGQRIRDRWMFLSELYMEDVGASTFAPMVKRHIAEFFPWAMAADGPGVRFWGDPAGMQGTQAGEITPQQVFHMNGLMVRPAVGAIRQKSRKEPVERLLMELSIEGGPRFMVAECCTMIIGGLQGGYHWKEVKGNRQATSEEPEKTPESHICEAMEYVVFGEGEGRSLLLGGKKPQAVDARSRNNPLTGKPRPAALFKQRSRAFQ